MIIIAIIVLLLTLWFWSNSFRAREAALDYCRLLCKSHQWQFLDDTVILRKIVFKRIEGRWHCVRTYVFEYTVSGDLRMNKSICLYGVTVMEPEHDNVIQFPVRPQ